MTDLDHDKRCALIRELMEAIYESVAITGDRGAPAGYVYAALLQMPGMTLEIYQNFENSLVEQGILRKSGQLLFVVPEVAKQFKFCS